MKYFLLLLELILVLGIGQKRNFFRNFLAIILLIIITAQIISIYITGSFIPEIAISNILEFLNIDKKYYIFSSLFILFLILVLYISNKFNKKMFSNISIILLILINLFYQKSCIRQFIEQSIISYRVNFGHKISTKDKEVLAKKLYKEKIVFDSNVSSYITPKKYNVIVFFVESLSDVAINKNIMPNLYNFRKKSIDVINYYNHTASTFRGLRGQLLSNFNYSATYLSASTVTKWMKIIDNNKTNKAIHKKYFDTKFGNRSDLISIFNILKNFGYHTYFQMTVENYHQGNYEFMNVFRSLGADETFRHYDKNNPNAMSDKESFYLLEKKLPTLKSPFFYGFYNLGTHAGKDVPDDGVKYGDGGNPYANIYHNFDFYFGKFLSWFNASEFSKDTILIITADHASYPVEGFIKTFGSKSKYFIDKIPLIIYKKGITPAVINANGLNSLALAPTICDILGITKAPNRFLGLSIFDRAKREFYNKISAMGERKYKVIDGKVTDITDDKRFKNEVKIVDKLEEYGG